ncbi:hypothetical protein SAMN04515691_3426 [Leifsonia sp. 98AMF]|nr:hypothetical protein SAMN04515690_0591 [Leifsonia sp. 197AMF]SDJ32434.1 hypothetical protein SAMN04515684_3192 [Leifsonia sp. 466MF]SDK47452.1 hypothetical protein SAMN04515683_3573 [Leifsonia sp. 157MF]SDN53599.1 hypothetical protein SAMN04515686_1377 [Leifsonia sp. 509MF]SEN56528.1 hypothetical protein SAMN04515685_3555 [Leifsonia sp. 467MF]SFM72663.1 hypothetical protein SAMN04515691_3426 [Leifsonia sp. 98AMF]
MSIESIVMTIAGFGAIVAGVAVILFRDRVDSRNKANIEQKLEGALPNASSLSTPARMAGVGVVIVIAGVIVAWRGLAG